MCYNGLMEDFKTLAKDYTGVKLSQAQLDKFSLLAKELLLANKKTNLTAIRTESEVYIKHFLDSLTLFKAIPENTNSLADVGSGAGFPGLPIAIVKPDINVTLIESIAKKIKFIENVIGVLDLPNAKTIHDRAEKLDSKYTFDVVVARAVASLPVLAEYCLPLTKDGGHFIAMKNAHSTEIAQAREIIKKLGGEIRKIIPISLPDMPARELIVIEKIKH